MICTFGYRSNLFFPFSSVVIYLMFTHKTIIVLNKSIDVLLIE